jgi:hypothetical protein
LVPTAACTTKLALKTPRALSSEDRVERIDRLGKA